MQKSYLAATDVSEREAYGQANPERNSTGRLGLESLSLRGVCGQYSLSFTLCTSEGQSLILAF